MIRSERDSFYIQSLKNCISSLQLLLRSTCVLHAMAEVTTMHYVTSLSPRVRLVSVAGLLTLLLSVAFAQDVSVDICVIGAGPAGVQAAYTAEARGHTVAVFEKNTYIGGKTKAVLAGSSSQPYLMGAGLHDLKRHNNLNKLSLEFGIEEIGPLPPESRFVKDGKVVDYTIPFFDLALQLLKYLVKLTILGIHIDGPKGLLSHYPSELNDPLQGWLNRHFVPAFNDVFWIVLTTYGYGHAKDVPAVYGLKYISSATLVAIAIGKWRLYPFQKLLQRMADSLQGTVYLNTDITGVEYGSESNTLTLTSNGNGMTAACGSTILAFPPTADAMEVFTPAADDGGLSDLVGQVKIMNYFSILSDDSQSYLSKEPVTIFHVPEPAVPDNPAVNLFYFKQQFFPGSSVSAYYLSPSEKSDSQALSESLASYSKLIGRPVDESFVQDFNRWVYFPHVNTESLNNGFYHKFDDYQGRFNQYYTGGLFTFEMVQE